MKDSNTLQTRVPFLMPKCLKNGSSSNLLAGIGSKNLHFCTFHQQQFPWIDGRIYIRLQNTTGFRNIQHLITTILNYWLVKLKLGRILIDAFTPNPVGRIHTICWVTLFLWLFWSLAPITFNLVWRRNYAYSYKIYTTWSRQIQQLHQTTNLHRLNSHKNEAS